MTTEDADDHLARIYTDMNRLNVKHAKNAEERKQMTLQMSMKIKEYAGVLLQSQCEIRLAVERAHVRNVVVKRFMPNDVQYPASLTPGFSHIPNCGGFCVSSYLPRRIADKSEIELVPELTRSEGSGCSTLIESPSTPCVSIADLHEEPNVMMISDETTSAKVLQVKSKTVNPTAMAMDTPLHKARNVTGDGKPV